MTKHDKANAKPHYCHVNIVGFSCSGSDRDKLQGMLRELERQAEREREETGQFARTSRTLLRQATKVVESAAGEATLAQEPVGISEAAHLVAETTDLIPGGEVSWDWRCGKCGCCFSSGKWSTDGSRWWCSQGHRYRPFKGAQGPTAQVTEGEVSAPLVLHPASVEAWNAAAVKAVAARRWTPTPCTTTCTTVPDEDEVLSEV